MADNVTLPGTGTVVATEEASGKHYQQMGIVNKDLVQIDPATSDDISNKDIMIALKALIFQIANPGWLDKTANQLRSQVTGSVVVSSATLASNQDIRTVATVSSVTNQVSMDGYQGKLMVLGISNVSWQLTVRNKIT